MRGVKISLVFYVRHSEFEPGAFFLQITLPAAKTALDLKCLRVTWHNNKTTSYTTHDIMFETKRKLLENCIHLSICCHFLNIDYAEMS